MEITVKGIKIFYERYEGEGVPVLILHGWGASGAVMRGVFEFLKSEGRSVINMDLPHFGKSETPPADFTVYDYANLCAEFLRLLGIEKVVILGHSFGGRLAIILGADYNIVEKLILTDAAGCKPKRGLRYRLKVLFYKIGKKLGFRNKNSGSADYKALPDNMKPVFVRVVNTHLDGKLAKIKAPTLLIWGERDADTPLYMAKRMNKKIPDSGLVILKNAGHYSFLDNHYNFCTIIKAFI